MSKRLAAAALVGAGFAGIVTSASARQLAVWSLLGLQVASVVVIEATGMLEPKVARDGKVSRFERDHRGAWFLRRHDDRAGHEPAHGHGEHGLQHQAGADDDEKIGAAFAALARARIERRLEPVRNPEHYGVMKPDMLTNVYGADRLQPLAR
jgi:hypothetical protein